MAVQFDGTTGRLVNSGVPAVGPVTLMAWVYTPTAISAARTFLSLQSAAFGSGYLWLGAEATGGYLYTGVFDDGGDFCEVDTLTHRLDIANWIHLALTRDGDEVRLWITNTRRGINCQMMVDLTKTGTLGTLTPTALYAGADDLNGDATPDECFDGAIGEIRVWEAALTRTEIIAERDSASAVRTADLFLDTPLVDSTDLTDDSGNGNDWTIAGGVTNAAVSITHGFPTSFTRLFTLRDVNGYGTAQLQAGPWNQTSVSGFNFSPWRQAHGSSGGVPVGLGASESNVTPGWKRLLSRGGTPRLAAQTISGTLDCCLAVLQNNADADFTFALSIFVVYSPSGGGIATRGTLLYDYTEPLNAGTEWPTTATFKNFAAPIALTPVVCQDGDWIQFEIGFVANNAIAASRTGTLWLNGATGNLPSGRANPAATVGSTNNTTEAGYIEFSSAISFLPVDGVNYSTPLAVEIPASGIPFDTPFAFDQDATLAGWGFCGPHPTCAPEADGGHNADLWFKWTPAANGTARFDYSSGGQAVLSGWSGTPDNLTQISCGSTTTVQTLFITAVAGQTVYLRRGSRFNQSAIRVEGQVYIIDPATNISCATATPVTTLPYTSPPCDASLAPTTTEPPASINPFVDSQDAATWWKFTSPITGRVVVDILLPTFWTDQFVEAQLTVWQGPCGSLVEVSNAPWWNYYDPATDDVEFRDHAKLVLKVAAGQDYYIVVSGTNVGSDLDSYIGPYQLLLSEIAFVGNDSAATAYVLPSATPVLVPQSNYGAQDFPEPTDPLPSCGDPDLEGKFLWYRWTAPNNNEVQVNTGVTTALFGLAIYTGTPGALVEQACEFTGFFSRVIFTPVAGTTYYFQIWDSSRTWNDGFKLFVEETGRGIQAGDIIIGCAAIWIFTPEGALRDYRFLTGYSFSGVPTNGSLDPADDTQLYVSQYGADQIVHLAVAVVPMTLIGFIPTTPGDRPEGNAFRFAGVLITGFRAGSSPADDFREYAVPAGTLTATWEGEVENEGTGWLDLAHDAFTVYYTSGGRRVMRSNAITGAQLADFTTLPSDEAGLYAQGLRILQDGGVVVADYVRVTRTNAAGAVSHTYGPFAVGTDVHVLDIAPDGLSIWVGLTGGNHVYRVRLSDGAILAHWTVPAFGNYLCGLAVKDGQRAIETVVCPVVGELPLLPATAPCPGVPGEF